MLTCDWIWTQVEMANAAGMYKVFGTDVLQYFWAHCLLIS